MDRLILRKSFYPPGISGEVFKGFDRASGSMPLIDSIGDHLASPVVDAGQEFFWNRAGGSPDVQQSDQRLAGHMHQRLAVESRLGRFCQRDDQVLWELLQARIGARARSFLILLQDGFDITVGNCDAFGGDVDVLAIVRGSRFALLMDLDVVLLLCWLRTRGRLGVGIPTPVPIRTVAVVKGSAGNIGFLSPFAGTLFSFALALSSLALLAFTFSFSLLVVTS